MRSGTNVAKEAADDKDDKTVKVSANRESSAPMGSLKEEERRGGEVKLEETLVKMLAKSSDEYITHTSSIKRKEEYKDYVIEDEMFNSLLEKNRSNKELKNDLKSALKERINNNIKKTQETDKIETNHASDVVEGLESSIPKRTEVTEVTDEVETGAFKEKEIFLNIHVELDTKEIDNVSENSRSLEGESCLMSDLNNETIKAKESKTIIEKPILAEKSLEGSTGETIPEEGTSGENQSSTLSNVSTVPHIFAFKKPKLKSASINRKFLNKAPIPPTTSIPKISATQMEKSGAFFSRRGSFLQASTSTTIQTNPGKPRLATKISSPAPYSLGGHQESVSIKSLDGKSITTKTSGFLSHNSAPVWGRNRKPPVREYTDEELSSMHGIHLVHRLSATSDDDKAGKWDEMDDDETDWSDTIEFADGTKFTLPHEDHTASSMPVELSIESEAVSTSTSHTKPTEPTELPVWTPSFMQTKTSETVETETTSQETWDKHISKEERFGEEHYDRSWNSQRPVVPQIYNVNTGKFDIVDDSTKNGRRAGRRASTDSKTRIGHNISFLSRHRASTQLRKEETMETCEQKPYKPISIIGNESRKKSLTLSEDSDSSSRNLPQHSAPTTGLTSTTKPALSQSTQPFDPMIENIEAFQRAIMIEAKEKARLRREEEEMERKMQQERARKKAEELAKLAQKPKLPETVPSKENDASIAASVSSQQESFTSEQSDLKTVNKLLERKKDLSNSSHSHTKTAIIQTHKSITRPNKPEMNIHESCFSETNVDNTPETMLKKKPSTISLEQLSHSEKNGKSAEANKQAHIDSKQKCLKSSHTSNQSNINDNWRKERTNISEKKSDKACISLDTSALEESLDSFSTPFCTSEKKKSAPLTANKSSNKSSPSHSRTSSRFFPTAAQTETVQSNNDSKTKKTDSPTSEYFEKQNILSSKELSNTTDYLIHTNRSNAKSYASQNTRTSQTASTHSLKRSSNTKAASATSTIASTLPSVPVIHPETNSSHSTRHSTRPSTRSFDDVMEQLARAGNFAQNNEKFASYLSNSKTPKDHVEDGLSVTTISPLEFENYPKSAINVSLHSLNHSNESFNMSCLSIIDENDTKPFVNLPASSYVYTEHQSVKQPKYFEPSQHTIDFTLYDEQEIDTLRLYLPETSPRNIKIKPSSTFLYKKLQKTKQVSIYNS